MHPTQDGKYLGIIIEFRIINFPNLKITPSSIHIG